MTQMHEFELYLNIPHSTSAEDCAYVAGSKKRSAAAAAVVAGGQGKSQQLQLGAAFGSRLGRRRAQRAAHVVSRVHEWPGIGWGEGQGCVLAVAAGAALDSQQLGAASALQQQPDIKMSLG